MYQQKKAQNYMLAPQLGLLALLLAATIGGEYHIMLVSMFHQFSPDLCMMIVSSSSFLWFYNLPLPQFSVMKKVRHMWRYRGDVMHGAMIPIRIVAPQQ
jgi:hypothetical protein